MSASRPPSSSACWRRRGRRGGLDQSRTISGISCSHGKGAFHKTLILNSRFERSLDASDRLMLEMKLQHRRAVLLRRADAVGVAAEHEAGQAAQAVVGVHDVAIGGTLVGQLEQGAAIGDLHNEIELVEM